MEVIKIFNNNVVQAIGEDGNEIIAMGKGLAFHAHGGNIDESKIEKVFTLKEIELDPQIEYLIKEIPYEIWDFAERVQAEIESELNIELNRNFLIAMADHIYVAIDRQKNHTSIPDVFTIETQYLYSKEFAVAKSIVERMKKEFSYDFPENEAGFIAMHIIDARTKDSQSENEISNLVNEILNIVDRRFEAIIDKDSINYSRFKVHLKYFANRVVLNEPLSNNGQYSLVYKALAKDFREQYGCVMDIVSRVKYKYSFNVPEEEQCYLLIHLAKLIEDNNSK